VGGPTRSTSSRNALDEVGDADPGRELSEHESQHPLGDEGLDPCAEVSADH
jgi:hypothetical protein